MDPVQRAFSKIKDEINSINKSLNFLTDKIKNLELQQNLPLSQTDYSIPTDSSTHKPTVPQEIRGFQHPFLELSTGNKGVPTDIQTNIQTNNFIDQQISPIPIYTSSHHLLEAEEMKRMLDSLDSIKKEIRLKFKKLTNKEMLVFTTIYSLQERGIDEISYKLLANNLSLTESSIRDYINKLISKNIPLEKRRVNNKLILLSIPSNFQRIASLQTILTLRDI